MIEAAVFLTMFLCLCTLGAVSFMITNAEARNAELLNMVRDLVAGMAEMAGEPRAARIVEHQAKPEDPTPSPERTGRLNRPTPHGLRAR